MCWIKAQFGPKKVLSLLSTVRVCILIPQLTPCSANNEIRGLSLS